MSSAAAPVIERRRSARSTHTAATSIAADADTAEVQCDTQEIIDVESLETVAASSSDAAAAVVSAPVAAAAAKKPTVSRQRSSKKSTSLKYDESRYTPQALVSEYWVGCHVSAAGGVHHAIENAALIGARSLALDLKSKRKWTSPPLAAEEAALFRATMAEFRMTPEQILPHGSYLMNLGSPNAEVHAKSRENLLDELRRCREMGLVYWNFHPGSTCGTISKEECIGKIADALNWAHAQTVDSSIPTGGVVTVIENMAGQGGVIGSTFDEIRAIIDLVHDKKRVGVCIDTCHTFAAGIDIRTKKDVADMLRKFDEVIGLRMLRGLHLNDSKAEFGSHRDRHEDIGHGCIGSECFRAIMNSAELKHLPLILETPCDDIKQWIPKYGSEIVELYGMEDGALPDTRDNKPTWSRQQNDEAASKKANAAASKKKKKAAAQEEDDDDDDSCADGEDDGEETKKAPPKPARKPSVKRTTSGADDADVPTKKPKRQTSASRSKK